MEVQKNTINNVESLKTSTEFKQSYQEINNLLPPVIEDESDRHWMAEVGPNVCYASEVKGFFDRSSLEIENQDPFSENPDQEISELKAKYQSKLDYLEFFNQKLVNEQIEIEKRKDELLKNEALSSAKNNEYELKLNDLYQREYDLTQALDQFEKNKENLEQEFRDHLVSVEKHRVIEQENLKTSHMLKKFRIELKTKADNLEQVREKLLNSKSEIEEHSKNVQTKEKELEKRERDVQAKVLDLQRREEALSKHVKQLKLHRSNMRTQQEDFVNSIYATLLNQLDQQEQSLSKNDGNPKNTNANIRRAELNN